MNNDALPCLQQVSYFSNLNTDELQLVARHVIERDYQADEIIFLENDPNAGLHLVITGHCKVYRLSEEGREQILVTLAAGDSCNEVAAVDDGPNPASLAALDDTRLWIITGESLTQLRQQIPDLNNTIIATLAMRCRHLVRQVYMLSFLPVTGRLAAFLLQQSNDANRLNRGRWTHDEIAAHLGTVREMVGRAFKELQEAELIRFNRHYIEILDRTGLEKLS